MKKLYIIAAFFILLSSISVFIFISNKHKEEVRHKQYIMHNEAICIKRIYFATILELINIDSSDILKMNSTNLKDIAKIGYKNEFNKTIEISDNYVFCDDMNLWVNSTKGVYSKNIAISKQTNNTIISICFDFNFFLQQIR